MVTLAISFAIGVALTHRLASLPPWWVAAAVGLLALGLLRYRKARPLAMLLAGLFWAVASYRIGAPHPMPGMDVPRTVGVVGQVESLVTRKAESSRFLFRALTVDDGSGSTHGDWLLRLSWREAPSISPGERLRLRVRLKPAHGFVSPGAWDFEGWLYRQGIRYTGYVRDGELLGGEGSDCCWVDRLRAKIAADISSLQISPFAAGVLRALVIGDSGGLSDAQRQLFSDTGTSHLMAISGLHIGLVAGLGYLLAVQVWRRLGMAQAIPASVAGALVAVSCGFVYAVLAGLSTPTQRALVMLAVVVIGVLARYEQRPSHALAIAALLVLLLQPAAIVSAGFWLSFGAVAAILLVVDRHGRVSAWRSAVRVQVAVSLGLWPLLSLFGLPTTAAAPLINLVLVLVFGFFVVPLSLLGVMLLQLLPDAGAVLLGWLAAVIDYLGTALQTVRGATSIVSGRSTLGFVEVLAVLLATLLLLSPRGIPMRWLGLPLIATTLLPTMPDVPMNSFSVHVLDVGQGLSVVVETRHHLLVFDTGPAYPSGFSTAEAVLLPFLQARHRGTVDRLVLSHADNDHAGGAEVLIAGADVASVWSGEAGELNLAASACRRGDFWFWDGVRFEWLHPTGKEGDSGNNASCVLRISNPAGVVLLTGDIESPVERRLVESHGDSLHADIVVVPHHGSRTSSTAPLVERVRPTYAVYTSGWANRYGFPAEDVVSRWQDTGALSLNTATAGTISFLIDDVGGVLAPRCARINLRRFWHHDGGSAHACHAVSSAHPK